MEGNFIGTDATGANAAGNQGGVLVYGTAHGLVGGTAPAQRNVISGNRDYGLYFLTTSATNNLVLGNFIGTDSSGANSVSNGVAGIYLLDTYNCQIGGPQPGARNVISGNGGAGVNITSTVSYGFSKANHVQSNYIGTDASGLLPLPNAGDGLLLAAGHENFIGGTGAGEGNLISGNAGIGLHSYYAGGNHIAGNLIGVDRTGTNVLPNSVGVALDAGSGNLIGGEEPVAANVIAGNLTHGVTLLLAHGGCAVVGNFIGTDRTGKLSLGNGGDGVQGSGAKNVVRANVICHNGGVGVYEFGDNHQILGNSIFDNAGGGIVYPNGNGPPVITNLALTASNTFIAGTISSSAFAQRIEFFTNCELDPLGLGQGRHFVGAVEIPGTNTAFAAVIPRMSPGQFLTATATVWNDVFSTSSQFSAGVQAPGDQTAGQFEFRQTSFDGWEVDGVATIEVVRRDGSDGLASVSYSVANGTGLAGVDYEPASGTLYFEHCEESQTFRVPIIDNALAQGDHSVNLNLSNPTGATLGSQSAAVLQIHDNDFSAGQTNFVDADGDQVALTLLGPGVLSVYLDDPDHDDRGAPQLFRLTGTTSASKLRIDVTQFDLSDARIHVPEISADSSLGSLIASNMNLTGHMHLGGGIADFLIFDLEPGASLDVGAAQQTTTATLRWVEDNCALHFGSRVARLQATRIERVAITAPAIDELIVTGSSYYGIPGDLLGEVRVTGDGLGPDEPALGNLRVTGAITGAVISVEGGIASVTSAQMVNSLVAAGYAPTDASAPWAGGQFSSAGWIDKVKIGKRPDPNAFVNSVIASPHVGKIKLAGALVDNNGAAFGVWAVDEIKNVKVRVPQFKWRKRGPADQSIGDFHVRH